MILSPFGPVTVTVASNAASAMHISLGCTAIHFSEAPKMACIRLYPCNAPHPEPGFLLLQGIATSKKYGHLVRCIILPPTVAILRSCGEAPAFRASESKG